MQFLYKQGVPCLTSVDESPQDSIVVRLFITTRSRSLNTFATAATVKSYVTYHVYRNGLHDGPWLARRWILREFTYLGQVTVSIITPEPAMISNH